MVWAAVSAEALGKRHRILGGYFSVAPDWYIWLWAYILTTGSATAVIHLSFDLWTTTYKAVAYGLMACNQVSSYVLLFSDPGIYPRGVPEVAEEREEEREKVIWTTETAAATPPALAYCHHCHLHRPPRTSHCYVCGVCVLEHDHHCVLLGVCIGKRSLRWFVLYLLSTTLQLYAGFFFLVISFRRTPLEDGWKKLSPPDGARTWTPEAITRFQDHATLNIFAHLAVMGIIILLMLPITAGTVTYVLLPLTNTTWREALSDGIRMRKPEEGTRHFWLIQLCVNVSKMLCAGPSLLSPAKEKRR